MIRRRTPVTLGLVLLAACAGPAEVVGVRVPVAVVAPAPVAASPAPPPASAPVRSPVDPQVRADLRRAAAERTNAGKALLMQAVGVSDERERRALRLRALNVFGLAARAWTGLFTLDPDAADAAETRYWLADAWHGLVMNEAALDGTRSPEDLASARRAAVSARDAATDGMYREAAAGMLIDIADVPLQLRYRLHTRTRGAQGIEERQRVPTEGEGAATRALVEPLPREVEDAIAARDAYLNRVPARDGPNGKRAEVAFQAANLHFVYGHLAQARRYLVALYDAEHPCGPPLLGFRAWQRLLDIAVLQQDIPAARALAESMERRSCQGGDPPPPRRPDGGDSDAYHLFERAEKTPPGPARDKLWRDAAAAYRASLLAGPDRDEAPEYALNGAYAYKQVGAYTEAMAVYRLFLDRYGSEASLARLAAGDAHATPPLPPDRRRYDQRRRYAQTAVEALAVAAVLSLDYEAAAATFDALAANVHFDPRSRRDAAHNALILHTHSGERDRALTARGVFARLDPPPGALAELDWLLASGSLDAWDERALDAGPNRTARLAALAEVERFVTRHEASPDAARWVVHAAHAAARLRRAAGDPQAAAWCARAVRAAGRLPVGGDPSSGSSPEAQLAAGCALAALDTSVRAALGATSGQRRYRGDAAAIEGALRADLGAVEARSRRVEDLTRRFGEGPWLVDAWATEASLVDACRAALAPLAVDERLRRALRGAEEKAARAYLKVVRAAPAFHVARPEVVEARRRLAALAARLGEPALHALSDELPALVYREGMFAAPPGMTAGGDDDLLAWPLPTWD